MNSRKLKYLLLLSILVMISCSVLETNIVDFEKENQEWRFQAQFAETSTKTAFQSDETSIWWSPGDEIAIYYGASEGSKFTSTNDVETARAEFRGKMRAFTGETESGDLNYFWSVYPYSSAMSSDGQSVVAELSEKQVAKAGSFAPNTNITIAKSPGLALSFYNTCSWFRFSVQKEGIKRVIFRGNNNEDIAGVFRVSIGEDGRPTVPVVVFGKKEITLESPEQTYFEPGKMYYVTLLPQVLQNGFTVTFETDNESGVRSINTKATYLRSKYNTGFEFDKNVVYEDKPVHEYNVGDILDSDGLGVVCWVSEDKTQAMLMSITELRGSNWSDSNSWCNSYGTSWRMPTIDDLTQIHSNFSSINSSLTKAGYTPLTTANKCYWSSTVNPSNSNYYYRERLYDGEIFTSCGSDEKATSLANYTRAIKMLPEQEPVQGYNVGDILDSDGLGVVCWVSADKMQAMLMSITELQGSNWSDSNSWCNSYGTSWRMPTIDDLTQIHSNFSSINSSLTKAGHTPLTTANKCYWSSTVNPSNSNYYYRERLYDGVIFTNCGDDEKKSSTANYSRAIKRLNQ